MLDAYLKDGETTTFRINDIGTNPLVWKELEKAGCVKLFPQFGTVEYDPYGNDLYAPDD